MLGVLVGGCLCLVLCRLWAQRRVQGSQNLNGIFIRGDSTCAGQVNSLIATTMTPDITLEHSVEQLISALNKKLLMECARVRPQTLQISRALVVTLTAEVRLRSWGGNSNSDHDVP